MPELPEVETIRRTLEPHLSGERLLEACFYSSLVLRGRPSRMASQLEGRTVASLARSGKFLLLEFESGPFLTFHLGMTGKLLWQHAPGPYTRARFLFTRGCLLYDDIRQFGRIEVSETRPDRVGRLGTDALSISPAEFEELLRGRRCSVKPLLLNQRVLGGLGNIYADEVLFRARIHPGARVGRLGGARLARLHQAIRDVLEAAIASGGSSISDYVDVEGRPGRYQLQHCVYGKAGLPCPVCGGAIRRIVIAQRGTHYCPACQRP